jgi:hypothetical protein
VSLLPGGRTAPVGADGTFAFAPLIGGRYAVLINGKFHVLTLRSGEERFLGLSK